MPYAITRVTTADGRLLYRTRRRERVLVAPWVAAEMTDLLQTAVLTGTGRAAQIGRPVAGKTGTTSSNKDGWFIGFSSGITTGVWMGRDDARPISGLQGGTAPAAPSTTSWSARSPGRPVEQFETEVPMPDWQLEPGEEATSRQRASCRSSRWSTRMAIRSATPAARSAPPAAAPSPPRRQPGRAARADRGSTASSEPPAAAAASRPAPPAARAPPRRRRPSAPADRAARPEPTQSARAAATGPPNSRSSERLEGGPWSMCTRCATSCATTKRGRPRRREDQPPAVADRARRRAAAPAAAGIADADRAHRHRPRRRSRRFSRSAAPRRRAASARCAREALSAGPPQRSSSPSSRLAPRGVHRRPRPAEASPPSNGIAPSDERLRGRRCASCARPTPAARPPSRARRGGWSARQVSLSTPASRRPAAAAARAVPHRPDFDRHRQRQPSGSSEITVDHR
jgi:hypothetical protein